MTKSKLILIETYDFKGSDDLTMHETEGMSESVQTDSRVDGKYIIGMIEGQFFKPDGMSRNKRWYPKELWENALNNEDVRSRFRTSTMFGEIGHSEGPVGDLTLRNGCASHFVDKMWIDERGRGMGRAYILNTPTGNLLKTYLGAGCKLKVSTRGEGMYKEGADYQGCPVVDPNTYDLQTADFVINPGFMETSANLKEAFSTVEENIILNKEQIEETIAHVKKEGEKRMTLDINAYVSELKEELKSAKAEIKTLSEELKAKDKELLQKQFNESAEIEKLNKELAPYKNLKSSAKTLKETFQKSQELLKSERASKKAISEELEAYKSKCGSLDEVEEGLKLSTKALSIVEEYRKFGSPSDIEKLATQSKALLESVSKMKESRKSRDLKSRKLLETYKKLGTPSDLAKLVKHSDRALTELKESKRLEENAMKMLEELKSARSLTPKVKKLMEEVKASRKLQTLAEKALKQLQESKKPVTESKEEKKVVKKSVIKEAMELSRKSGETVEKTAKLIKAHGVKKASAMVESKKPVRKTRLAEGKDLVKEASKLDTPKEKVEKHPEQDAKSFLKGGMIKDYFNMALGKETIKDLNKLDPEAELKSNKAKDLLKKYSDVVEVEKAPKIAQPKLNPEKEANKLIK